jgi:DNA-binding GntR family transcriptional regulator
MLLDMSSADPLRGPQSGGTLPRAAARVYAVVRRDLLEGVIRPGERVPDAQLRETLGVSRTPVRDAMLALEQEGLVRVVPRQGYFASEVSLSDVVDAYQLRFIIEPIITGLAAVRATDEAIARLDALAHAQAGTSENGLADAIQLNKQFHQAVAEVAGSPRLVRILTDLLDALGRLAIFDLQYWRTPDTWRSEHIAITAAIATRDAAHAAAVDRATFDPDEGLLLRRTRTDIAQLLATVHLGTQDSSEAAARSADQADGAGDSP